MKIGVIGASGYAGGELLRLLAGHSEFEVCCVSAHSNAGEEITSVHPQLTTYAGQKFWHDLQSAAHASQTMGLGASSHFSMWLGDRVLEETGGRAPFADVWDRKGVRPRLPETVPFF